ncbi:MAG: hypothetical protein TUN42_00345 [Dehalogenimonas sp.]
MRLPRDIGGQDLVRRLALYGYSITRQTGCHVKIMSAQAGREHQITIATGRLLRMATLNNILTEIAGFFALEKEALITALFTA